MVGLRACGKKPFAPIPGHGEVEFGAESCGAAEELLEREAGELVVAEVGHARLVDVDERSGHCLALPASEAVDDDARDLILERRDRVRGWHVRMMRGIRAQPPSSERVDDFLGPGAGVWVYAGGVWMYRHIRSVNPSREGLKRTGMEALAYSLP